MKPLHLDVNYITGIHSNWKARLFRRWQMLTAELLFLFKEDRNNETLHVVYDITFL